ncbi:MAG: glutamate synthase large subunit [Myxococcales bacterium]|nr:MAG: glutamate synthase large subunit [Myxococcales bacterium]
MHYSLKRHGLYDPQLEHDGCGVGFVAKINGEKSRGIVEDALQVLARLAHRSASGWDPETSDGAGILVQIPHRFFKEKIRELGIEPPRRRRYGVGQVFLPRDPRSRAACEAIIEQEAQNEGQEVLGWRDVPIRQELAGPFATEVMPVMRQIFVRLRRVSPSAVERKLYVIRKLAENRIHREQADPEGKFHIASFSTETIVYKGLILPERLGEFYLDLQDPLLVTAIGLVHSRFSTNTFPSWDLAQPFRLIAHNGEINTVRGNRNWMTARRNLLQSAKFGGSLDRLFPIIGAELSDSAQFDNMLELLYLGGRSLPNSVLMLIPEAWEGAKGMESTRRDFYNYLSSLMEPWDGPAAVAFTDGQLVGASLDRNGLRPMRYLISKDGRVVLASEAGLLDIPPEEIRGKGRLKPGKIFVVDTSEGRILEDDEVKADLAGRFPYGKWLEKNVFHFKNFPEEKAADTLLGDELLALQRAFGYSDESLKIILSPMAQEGKEPIGSMGTDTPLAVLSQNAPRLFEYFHQLFAQVTNPAIDPIRESLVMSLQTSLGGVGNTFDETPEQCHLIRIGSPIMSNADLARISAVRAGVFEPVVLSLLYSAKGGEKGLERAVKKLCRVAQEQIEDGHNILILSDRGVDKDHLAIPSLLAASAVHQHIVREGIRMEASLVVECGDAFEVHDFAMLTAVGATAINPYLAMDSIHALCQDGELDIPVEQAIENYIQAVNAGLLKVMSKMGISTIQSYRGSQIFEIVGLNRDVVDQYFTGTPSRLEGIGMFELGREVIERHSRAFGQSLASLADPLPLGGVYQWRRRGELHKWNPQTVALLQSAVKSNDFEIYEKYARSVNNEDNQLATLRGQFDLVVDEHRSIDIDEVESEDSIVQRFVTGAMSFGSISAEAHETLAIAMNRLKARSNSGEGGEEPHRFYADENGDLRRSAIKQVASGRFGVHVDYLVHADDLQIKVAQGAKPGEGGQLPGHKVDERIAKVRCSTPGVTLISPPPHHDIYSIEDLAQLIYDLQVVNPSARISVKLVSEVGVGTVAAGVAKARAGCVVIAGYSGGTGASPLSSIKRAGLPWELGLSETQQVLVQNRLRDRIRVQVDGGLRTGRDVMVAALLGAEEFGMATASLIAEGCIMLRKCHLNTCSVGIATQDPVLREKFAGKAEYVENFFRLVARDVRQHMAALGIRRFDALVGRVDLLKVRQDQSHWKASKLDFSQILAEPRAPSVWARSQKTSLPWSLENHLDQALLAKADQALEKRERLKETLTIRNTDRAVGTLLSGHIARSRGGRTLPDDSVHICYRGTAGQSFGAFAAQGLTLELEGEANDYVGKGLSGARIVVYPDRNSQFNASENIIVGNTVLYGATAGSLFAEGRAGERFAVRNSGATAVIEGVGDHGCEYMTGGVVVVLGETGRNFAAGMSGGVAFVFNREESFAERCNLGMVELEAVSDESDQWLLKGLLEKHVRYTRRALAARILDNWDTLVSSFIKVMPIEYKKILLQRRSERPLSKEESKRVLLHTGGVHG